MVLRSIICEIDYQNIRILLSRKELKTYIFLLTFVNKATRNKRKENLKEKKYIKNLFGIFLVHFLNRETKPIFEKEKQDKQQRWEFYFW